MAISQLPQAPYRQDRKLFPTPLIGDVIFSEIRDCTRTPFPEYGTAHPNERKWPHHKLVFIKPVDIERNEIFEFFYAADRENQDLYNFASGTKNIVGSVGGRSFRTVQRTYVTLRSIFEPFDIPFGTPMPDIPAGTFDGVDYIFFEKQQAKIEQQELDSIYVAEIHTYVELAILDDKLSYAAVKEDPIPEKFKVQIPQVTTEELVEGLIEQPTLITGQLSESQDQLTPDVKLIKKVNRNVTSAPALSGKIITNELQVGSVTESIVADGTTITPTAFTVSGSVETLGNGQSVQKVITVPELFTAATYTAEKPDLIPEKFKAAIPAVTVQIDSAGTSSQPTLTGDELAVSDQQVNAFVKRKRTTTRNLSSTPTLDSTVVTNVLQKATLSETIVADTDVFLAGEIDALTLDASIENLGNGKSLKKIVTAPSLFTAATYTAEKPDLIPEKFKAAIPAVTVQIDSAGTSSQPTLTGDELAVSDQQVNAFVKRKRTTTRNLSSTPTLDSTVVTNVLQKATLSETIVADTDVFLAGEIDALTLDASIENLGNGKSLKKIVTAPSLFAETTITFEKPDLTPLKFKALLPTITDQNNFEGVPISYTLSGDDLSITQKQVNEFVTNARYTYRAVQSTDLTLTGKRNFVEGAEATTTETLSTSQLAPDSGLLVVDSQVSPLGDGRFIKESLSVTSWPTLYSAEWDHTIKAQVLTESTYVSPDSVSLTDDYVSYKPINKNRTLIDREIVPTTELSSYLLGLPTLIDLKLPNVLRSVDIVTSTSGGHGGGFSSSAEVRNGDQYAISVMGSKDVSSAGSIKADLKINIEQPWGSDVPAMVYYFYINAPTGVVVVDDVLTKLNTVLNLSGPSQVYSWPFFEPVSHTIVVSGQSGESSFKESASTEISESKKNYSYSRSVAGSSSNRSQLNNDVVTIPPTLHGDITFGGAYNGSHTLTSSNTNQVISGIPRYRFNNGFSANADDIITLWPYGHKFVCDRNVVNATSFSNINYGVYARKPFINGTPPTTSDTKIYIGGIETDVAPLHGDERIKFSDPFTAAANDIITMFPSWISFTTAYAITDPTNFSTNASGVVVDYINNIGVTELLTTDTDVFVNLQFEFELDIGASIAIDAGDEVTLTNSAGTGGTGFTFICNDYVTVNTTDPRTFYVKVYAITNRLLTPNHVTDTHVKINGGSTTPAAFVTMPTPTPSVLSADKQTPITTSFVAEEYPVLSSVVQNGTPTTLASLVSPYFLPKTTPEDIPKSGNYLVQFRVEPYKWDWLKCMAVVFDASHFD